MGGVAADVLLLAQHFEADEERITQHFEETLHVVAQALHFFGIGLHAEERFGVGVLGQRRALVDGRLRVDRLRRSRDGGCAIGRELPVDTLHLRDAGVDLSEQLVRGFEIAIVARDELVVEVPCEINELRMFLLERGDSCQHFGVDGSDIGQRAGVTRVQCGKEALL